MFAAATDYLKGLIQAESKNMERMEEVVVDSCEQSLQHMLTDSPWEHRAVFDQVARDVDGWLGGGAESALLIDETSFVKKGKHSVGVARQWRGRLGKVENCQVGVSAALGRGHPASLLDMCLFVPKAWIEAPKRCDKVGIPSTQRQAKSKSESALEMIAHQRALGVRFAWVGVDGG